eukprot:gnl/TRDRNA2_/TRDRNA2_133906_c2_seq1.p1 gnl/TRDRNA2_/TRDRNA2_133906_c2~~gnl/TRDRNA2_/TRDRNA2_133906_c2_seq1.p1  ORF type:complete len:259 (+),score=45.12 gnl/TRDRNA2_/TRDRNA2_133906_c2_seq1:594-1370(+)
MMQAHICNRNFQRAPLQLPKIFEFPHMTFARLELGFTERRGNSTIWLPAERPDAEGLDISAVLQSMNEELRKDNTVYRLHPAHFEVHFYGNRYNIIGGAARQLFRRIQARLHEHCAILGESVGYWAQEPAHPHITFEYPDDNEQYDAEEGCAAEKEEEAEVNTEEACDVREEGGGSDGVRSTGNTSTTSSLESMMEKLKEHRLEKLGPIFRQQGITSTVLPTLTEALLVEIGVKKVGDRQKVLMIAQAALSNKEQSSS